MKDRTNNLFLFGCPRSGTTWTQIILAQHAAIATGRETHLFDRYIGPMVRRFREEGKFTQDGLKGYMRESDLVDLLTPLARHVVGAIQGDKPARYILEKTPGHIFWADLIECMFPNSRYMQVSRDPRSVVASYQAVARHRWGAWARKSTEEICNVWLRSFRKGQQLQDSLGQRYIQFRFEDLKQDTRAVARDMFLWLDLDSGIVDAADFLERVSIESTKSNDADGQDPRNENREGFFRSGRTDSWKEELSAEDVKIICDLCGVQMHALSYDLSS